jgi:hypothetical protein
MTRTGLAAASHMARVVPSAALSDSAFDGLHGGSCSQQARTNGEREKEREGVRMRACIRDNEKPGIVLPRY